jgi:hypothetical protein
MGALTPPVKAAQHKRAWIRDAAAFTLAGAVTSALIGTLLGSVGHAVGLGGVGTVGVAIALSVALVAAGRELGLLPLPLPQLGRQTDGRWVHMGRTTAAVLWGMDLGLFATTWLTFAGAWLIPVLAVLGGSPGFAVALFVTYWSGRAVSVWVAPAFMRNALDTSHMLNALTLSHRTAQLVHVAALAWAISILVVMAASSYSV